MPPASNDNSAAGTEQNPRAVRWLMFAVVTMGIMIVLGVIGLIGRIIYMANTGPRSAATTAASQRLAPASSLAIPAGHAVRQVSLSGDRLAIHYEGPGGGGIAIVDLASGHVLSRIQLVPEVPR